MVSPPPPWATLKEPTTSSSPAPSYDDEPELPHLNATRAKRKARHTAATPSSSTAKPSKLPRLHLDEADGANRSSGAASIPQPQRRVTHHFDSRDIPSTKPSLSQHILKTTLMRKSTTSAATRIVRRKNKDKKPYLSPTPSPPPVFKKSSATSAVVPSRHLASTSTSSLSAPPSRKQNRKPDPTEVIVISDDDDPPSISAPSRFPMPKGKGKPISTSKGKAKASSIDTLELSDSSSSLPPPSALLKAKTTGPASRNYPIFTPITRKTKSQKGKVHENVQTRTTLEGGRDVIEIIDTSDEEGSVPPTVPSSSSHAQSPTTKTSLPSAIRTAAPPPSPRKSANDIAIDSYFDSLLTSIVAAQNGPITSSSLQDADNISPETRHVAEGMSISSLPSSRASTLNDDHRMLSSPDIMHPTEYLANTLPSPSVSPTIPTEIPQTLPAEMSSLHIGDVLPQSNEVAISDSVSRSGMPTSCSTPVVQPVVSSVSPSASFRSSPTLSNPPGTPQSNIPGAPIRRPLPRRSLIEQSFASSPINEPFIRSVNTPDVLADRPTPVSISPSRTEDNLHALNSTTAENAPSEDPSQPRQQVPVAPCPNRSSPMPSTLARSPRPSVEGPTSTPPAGSDRTSTTPSDRSASSSGLDDLRALVRRSRVQKALDDESRSCSPKAPSVSNSSASEVEDELVFPSLVYPDTGSSTTAILDVREPLRDVVSGSEPPSPPASSDADSMPATSPTQIPEPESEVEIELDPVPDAMSVVEDESELELEYWDGDTELPLASSVEPESNVTLLKVDPQVKPRSTETPDAADLDIAPTTTTTKVKTSRETAVSEVLALFGEYYETALPVSVPKTPLKDIVDELQALETIHVHSPSRSPTPYQPSADHRLVLSSSKTLGGNPVFTWDDVLKDLSNFKQPCKLAKDIPHSLQDYINRMDAWHRSLPGMRNILEAAIGENTAEDEPNAPAISIVNNCDDEPCPPWEFYYTNFMWHDEGVPPPDMTGLKGCSCYPRCDPKNGTCSCLVKQRSWSGEFTPDFTYDSRGRLKYQNVPIFECNDLCRCDDDCRNRVVQNGRKCAVQIGKTKNKGWGVFAGPKKIYAGTFLGIYSGELLTEEVAEERGKKYNKWGRTYLFNLDFYYLREGKEEEWEPKYVVDAYHAGNFTRFLNHSCSPNARLNAVYINESNIEKPLLAIFACKDIEPHAEICFSYSGNYDEDDLEEQAERVEKGDAIYERCMCGAKNCTGIMFD